jgi:hypothetical protein
MQESPLELLEPVAAELAEPVTKDNCGAKLKRVREIAGMSRRDLAKVIGVSEGTLRRLEGSDSHPTDEFMARLHALCIIGISRFRGMSDAQREEVSSLVGAGGGVIAGIGGALAAVSGAGTVAGLSAAGITSGLAAIGGGTMLAGLGVVASIPIMTGLAGYGLVKGLKAILDANNLESREVDGRWEVRTRETTTDQSDDR